MSIAGIQLPGSRKVFSAKYKDCTKEEAICGCMQLATGPYLFTLDLSLAVQMGPKSQDAYHSCIHTTESTLKKPVQEHHTKQC